MPSILVTGAYGQIGAELVPALQQRFGADRIVLSDIRVPMQAHPRPQSSYEHVDCTQPQQILDAVRRHDIDTIYHLAALLSTYAPWRPENSAWFASTRSMRMPIALWKLPAR